jgi:hypothetical protein
MATRLHGKIVAADSTEKTITIQCDGSIKGVEIGSRAAIELNIVERAGKMHPDDLVHTGEVNNDDPDGGMIHSEDEEWK